MTQTKADPRPALWLTRARLVDNLTRQRRALAQTCGCANCADAQARQQMLTLIRANMLTLNRLNDAICDRN